jgi:hypothetical protein
VHELVGDMGADETSAPGDEDPAVSHEGPF